MEFTSGSTLLEINLYPYLTWAFYGTLLFFCAAKLCHRIDTDDKNYGTWTYVSLEICVITYAFCAHGNCEYIFEPWSYWRCNFGRVTGYIYSTLDTIQSTDRNDFYYHNDLYNLKKRPILSAYDTRAALAFGCRRSTRIV